MIGLLAGPALACVIDVPFDVDMVRAADTIFRGRLVSYEPMRDEFATAKLTFDVIHTYRGEEATQWVAIWQNSTFAIPEDQAEFERYYGTELIVGIVPPGRLGPSRPPSSTIIAPKAREAWTLPWVLQAPCAPPFMGGVEEMKSWLRRAGLRPNKSERSSQKPNENNR